MGLAFECAHCGKLYQNQIWVSAYGLCFCHKCWNKYMSDYIKKGYEEYQNNNHDLSLLDFMIDWRKNETK